MNMTAEMIIFGPLIALSIGYAIAFGVFHFCVGRKG